MVEQCPADDPDTEVNLGCLLYKVVNCINLYSSQKATIDVQSHVVIVSV